MAAIDTFGPIAARWVNEGYGESCLEVAEELANQTPVRLDLLLSLVPPPESTETVVVGAKTDVSQCSGVPSSTQPTVSPVVVPVNILGPRPSKKIQVSPPSVTSNDPVPLFLINFVFVSDPGRRQGSGRRFHERILHGSQRQSGE